MTRYNLLKLLHDVQLHTGQYLRQIAGGNVGLLLGTT